MFRSFRITRIDFDVPVPIAAGGVLFAGVLAKEGCAEWALGGLAALYLLYLVTQCCKRPAAVSPRPVRSESL